MFKTITTSYLRFKSLRLIRGLRGNNATVTKVSEPIQAIIPVLQPKNDVEFERKPRFGYFEKSKVRRKDRVTEENKIFKLSETVTPLWRVAYEQQLEIKYKNCAKILKNLTNDLSNLRLDLPKDRSGLPCPLELTRPSPEKQAYRNKDEFSMRQGLNGERTVGFFIGNFTEGEVICVEPSTLSNMKKEHLYVAKVFQSYICESQYDVSTSVQNGYWKRLIVRSNCDGEMMVIVIMNPQQLTKEELDTEKEKIKQFFMYGPGRDCNVTSLYFQACPHSRCTHKQAPFQLLAGEPHLIETIDNLKFRISPETFLQVNTGGANVLYDTIKSMADIRKDTTLLDICCGAGAISLSLSNIACRTVGIEISEQAVNDAKFNAELNGIKNASFYRGRAERLVPELMPELLCSDCVAIVNPGRGGLESSVITALRESKHLRRIVYIACKPEGKSKDNFIELCQPARKQPRLGKPFLPIHAVPVDMFPDTYHCELVIAFERY